MNLFVCSLYGQVAPEHMVLSVPPGTHLGAGPCACPLGQCFVSAQNAIVVQDRRPRRITSLKEIEEGALVAIVVLTNALSTSIV